jgi:hypothetical protein
MNPSRRPLSRLLFFVFATLLIGAGQAQARRGFKLFTMGETVSEVGTVSDDVTRAITADTGPRLNKIGFKYDYFGLFWLDLWNWGGEYVAYNSLNEDTVYKVSKTQAADMMGIDEGKLGKPLNYRFPYLLMILIGLALLKFVPRYLAKRKQAAAVPQWSPQSQPRPNYEPPQTPSGSGPPPMPPPMPPEQQ